jgi:hypothetical protein
VKGLVLAMVCGGMVGLSLGNDAVHRDRNALLLEARAALGSDLQARDVNRSLSAVDALLEQNPRDSEASATGDALRRQDHCRRSFALGEHALAVGDPLAARSDFDDVGAACDLHDFAQRRLEQLELEWGVYAAGANRAALR